MGQGVFAALVTVVVSLVLAAAYRAVLRNSPLQDPLPTYLPRLPKLEGVYTPNNLLQEARKIGVGKLPMPEDIVADHQGILHVGCSDGWVKRVWPFEDKVENWTYVGGHPLGLALGNNGELIVCEPYDELGLLNVTEQGVTVLTDEADGVKFKLVDAAVVADDGMIYFTDASSKYSLKNWRMDGFEGRPNGRVLRYNPADKTTSVLIKDLHFPNGIALSTKQDFLVFAETTRMRLHKYWLKGEKQRTSEVFLDGLPGFPDNVHASGHGTFHVALVSASSAGVLLLRSPFLKHLITLLPPSVTRIVDAAYSGARILEVSENGKPVKMYSDSTGEFFNFVTVGQQVGDYLYIGGLNADFIGQLELKS